MQVWQKKHKTPRAFFFPQIFELHCAKIDVLPLVTEHKVQSSSGHLVKRPTHLSLELESANLSSKSQIVIILGFLGHIWSRSHILFYFIFLTGTECENYALQNQPAGHSLLTTV